MPKFPRIQIIPVPYEQLSFELDMSERLRYHYGRDLPMPFIFPVIGPAGRSVTRMSHPHDPVGHAHHRSVWIAHYRVNGMNFWDEARVGRIRHERIELLKDGDESASAVVTNLWETLAGVPLLRERRTITLQCVDDAGDELLIEIILELTAIEREVVFEQTPFGLLGVRVAKTMSVNDGDGIMRNSEGGVNEEQILWKRARWVDASGYVTPVDVNGVTLMDHPSNPNHPTYFHVRNDGWMCASLSYGEAVTVTQNEPLKLHYGLYVHGGDGVPEKVQPIWERFACR